MDWPAIWVALVAQVCATRPALGGRIYRAEVLVREFVCEGTVATMLVLTLDRADHAALRGHGELESVLLATLERMGVHVDGVACCARVPMPARSSA